MVIFHSCIFLYPFFPVFINENEGDRLYLTRKATYWEFSSWRVVEEDTEDNTICHGLPPCHTSHVRFQFGKGDPLNRGLGTVTWDGEHQLGFSHETLYSFSHCVLSPMNNLCKLQNICKKKTSSAILSIELKFSSISLLCNIASETVKNCKLSQLH